MLAGQRSLNLSDAAAVGVFEGLARARVFRRGLFISDERLREEISPAVPVRELFCGDPLGRPEVGALRIGDREQATLAVLLERDAEDFGGLLFAIADQMQGRPRRTQPAPAQRHMKLHTAGNSEPQKLADLPAGCASGRPSRHGINIIGASCRCLLSYFAELDPAPICSSRISPRVGLAG